MEMHLNFANGRDRARDPPGLAAPVRDLKPATAAIRPYCRDDPDLEQELFAACPIVSGSSVSAATRTTASEVNVLQRVRLEALQSAAISSATSSLSSRSRTKPSCTGGGPVSGYGPGSVTLCSKPGSSQTLQL